jgi:glycerol-3-phosphate acyltransferase PlsY
VVTGQDLGQLGSGNVGVMNTALSVARWAGLLVFLPKAGKGVLAVALARTLDGGEASAQVDREVAIALTVLATVAGTRWSSLWAFLSGPRRT